MRAPRRLARLAIGVFLAALVGATATLMTTEAAMADPTSSVNGWIQRSEILSRANSWVGQGIPYSQSGWRTDQNGTYRTDCSGFVSMAWHLGSSRVTYGDSSINLAGVSTQISKDSLVSGDLLMKPGVGNDGHAILFVSWNDSGHTSYDAYEFNGSGVWHHAVTYSSAYIPYRYNHAVPSGAYFHYYATFSSQSACDDQGIYRVNSGQFYQYYCQYNGYYGNYWLYGLY